MRPLAGKCGDKTSLPLHAFVTGGSVPLPNWLHRASIHATAGAPRQQAAGIPNCKLQKCTLPNVVHVVECDLPNKHTAGRLFYVGVQLRDQRRQPS